MNRSGTIENGTNRVGTVYTVRIMDVLKRVTEIPTNSLEEFASLVATLAPEKVVLNTFDNSIKLSPRLNP